MERAPVNDDAALLAVMMDDLDAAPQQYKATNYWANYERQLVPYLEEVGLAGFRTPRPTQGSHVLRAFGATDPIPRAANVRRLDENRYVRNKVTAKVPGFRALASRLADRADRFLITGQVDETARRRLAYDFTLLQGREAAAVPLDQISFPMNGDPEDAFEVDGRWYTRNVLKHYLYYAYAGRFIDYADVQLYAELGSGVGHQAQIFASLHPEATVVLFDLPPQLYVCHQYLASVFGDRVVPYDQSRGWTDLSGLVPGKIHLFGSWAFELLEDQDVDLFWNGASFQEMEPDVVLNYLSTVDACAANVFIQATMDGKDQAAKPGDHGVLEPTKLHHYEQGLPSFERVDLRPTLQPDATIKGGKRKYSDSFWRRRES